MDDEYRAAEQRSREAAQAGIAKVEGGQEVRSRELKQMLSLRLEPQLLRELREFAEQRGVSVSDVLRQAAVDLLTRASQAQIVVSITQAQTQQPISGISIQSSPTGTGSIAGDRSPRVA
jgi:hypothetical protein